MKPAAILFDMDDVLCAYDPQARIARIAEQAGCAPAHVRDTVFTEAFFERVDTGVYADGAAYLEAFNAALGHPIDRAGWISARADSMSPFNDMLALAARMREDGLEIGIYTNNDPLLREALPQLFPQAVALFGPAIVVSASLGAMKPDPQSFRLACARLGFEPARTLFVDDKPENVDGAIEAGCLGHVFEGTAGLRARLAAMGIAT